MSMNRKRLWLIIIVIILVAVGGFIVGDKQHAAAPAAKPVSSIVVRETIEPYTGVGSGVYKHGTIVELNEAGQPTVVGSFTDDTGKSRPGTWVIHKLVTEK